MSARFKCITVKGNKGATALKVTVIKLFLKYVLPGDPSKSSQEELMKLLQVILCGVCVFARIRSQNDTLRMVWRAKSDKTRVT